MTRVLFENSSTKLFPP